MDLWEIRVLDAVVTTGTMSGAAAIVRRTQPQISRIVKNLEAELGFELFLRIRRRLVPTPNCLVFLNEGRNILDRVTALDDTARALRAQQQPDLHVVAPSYAFHGLLPTVVAQLRTEMPNVPLTVSGLHRHDDGKWMMPAGFNVGLAILPFDLADVVQHRIGALKPIVVVPRGHDLAGRDVLTVKDLGKHPFVALRQAAPLRRRLDRLFEAEGIRPNIVMTVPDTTSALRMVIEGVGITVGNLHSARAIGGSRVETIRFHGMQPAQLGVFWPSNSPSHSARTRFLELCTEVLAKD